MSSRLQGLNIQPVSACPVSSAFPLGPEYACELQLLGAPAVAQMEVTPAAPLGLCRLSPAEGEEAIPYLQSPLP